MRTYSARWIPSSVSTRQRIYEYPYSDRRLRWSGSTASVRELSPFLGRS